MLNQTSIYRVSMALKNRGKRAETDLKDLVEDLAGAKDEYNVINDAGHRLLLLEPTSKRLNLLFKPGQNQEFEAPMLADFEAVLRDEFDWLVYCEQDNALLEKKIALNPGLSSRVPHQIHFPDYSAEELFRIFKQHLGQGYRLDKEAITLLKGLLSKIPSSPARQGGNGRFVRNIIERLKMKQSKRLLRLKTINAQALQRITADDVKALLNDADLVTTQESNKTIGF